MKSRFASAIVLATLLFPLTAIAQPAAQTSGAVVIVAANGTVIRPNDEAHAIFFIEEQDKDKAAAASRVNQKTRQGLEILKREDPKAKLTTRGYYSYPVYSGDSILPSSKARQIVGWRVGQYVEATTENLAALPTTVAAAQSVLALNGLRFVLAEKTARSADDELIADTYRHLVERVGSIAKAMGRNPADAVFDTVDYEGSGNYAPQAQPLMRAAAPAAKAMGSSVEEPNFEPGETTLNMRVVGRVRFK